MSFAAAVSGSVPLLQWLRSQSVAYTEHTMAGAAAGGHEELCQFLLTEGCPWSAHVTLTAARYGQLPVLHWLLWHDCPYHVVKMCAAAAIGGSVCVIRHLRQHFIAQVTHPAVLTLMLQAAGAHDQLETAQWLRAQGAGWPAVLKFRVTDAHTARVWYGETLDWARSEGCTSPLH
jgi:hypothetical protein